MLVVALSLGEKGVKRKVQNEFNSSELAERSGGDLGL